MDGTVLVTGATGRVGGALVEELVRLGQPVRAAVRRASRRPAAWPRNVAEVEFDFDRPETFRAALEGVSRLFLIARPGDDNADQAASPLLDEVRRRHVDLIVNLTAMGAEQLPGTALRRIEVAIEDSGTPFTHLRPNFFMQIFAADPLLSSINTRGAIAVPAGDARLSFVDSRDVAAVAAAALTDTRHAGRAYTLTGGRALGHAEAASAISRAAGRPIHYIPITEDEARRLILGAGLPPARADRLIGFYRHVRDGHCSPVTGDVARVLGRPPLSFEDFARDHAEHWRGVAPAETHDGGSRVAGTTG